MDHFGIKRTNNQTKKQTNKKLSDRSFNNSDQYISPTMVTKYLQFWTSLYTDVVLFSFLVVVLLAREKEK